MIYARINLEKTNYSINLNWRYIKNPDVNQLQIIYATYCRHKQFPSVMPIFDSEYTDIKNDVIGYYINNNLEAFSLIRRHDTLNIEAIQFAWTYSDSKLRLGINSLKQECSIYKKLGYKFFYIGGADEYKSEIDGFEILKGF